MQEPPPGAAEGDGEAEDGEGERGKTPEPSTIAGGGGGSGSLSAAAAGDAAAAGPGAAAVGEDQMMQDVAAMTGEALTCLCCGARSSPSCLFSSSAKHLHTLVDILCSGCHWWHCYRCVSL